MERQLVTIQKVEKLNNIFALDNKGPGNANHRYLIENIDFDGENDDTRKVQLEIQFQEGPRKDPNSISGVIDSDLLEIVKDRLEGFQSGDFATNDNAKALEHVELALMYLNKRVMDRYERNVLGTNEK